MSELLQQFDYRNSPYHRPNQKWLCGRLQEGLPCDRGPNASGRCQIDFECTPTQKGDRWLCARSTFAGGGCEHGPMPDGTCCRPMTRCRPIRSWRARITFWSRWAAVLTIGLLLFVLASSDVARWASPGLLTFQHADIGCAACHTATSDTPSNWVQTAFAGGAGLVDAKRCLNCHQFGVRGLRAHNRSTSQLSAATKQAAPATKSGAEWSVRVAEAVFMPIQHDNETVGCAKCHSEHRGAAADLKRVDETRCQSCHAIKFSSLSSGHPNFSNYPFRQHTRIKFDHVKHFSTHFRKRTTVAAAPQGCSACHEADRASGTMLLKPFADACHACHAGQIVGVGRATAKGIEVFNVPGLDIESLIDAGITIGSWPEDAEGEITPFMAVLLSAAPDLARSIDALHGEDLLDLADADAERRAHVEAQAWGVKQLLFDVITRGSAAMRERLTSLDGAKPNDHHIRLIGQLPRETFATVQSHWFPKLYKEVPLWRADKLLPPTPKKLRLTPPLEPASSKVGAKNDILADGKKSGEGQGEDILTDNKIMSDSGDILADEKKSDEGDDILADNKITSDSGDILGDNKKPDDGADILGDGEQTPAVTRLLPVSNTKLSPIIGGEEWAQSGGWYPDDFSIRYRPFGHADPFMVAWLDFATTLYSSRTSGAAARLLDALAEPNAPGRCGKCHSIEAFGEGSAGIHWQAKRPELDRKKFTKFSHRAHFSLLDEEGCLSCHSLRNKSDNRTTHSSRDPSEFASNFKSIPRVICAKCHMPTKAGDSCLSCHNYHIGNFPPAFVSAPTAMPKSQK